MNSYYIGSQKINRLAKHTRLGLDSTNAPSHNAQAINHCGVRVGANQSVWIV
jgi:hypothetical protein